jgi:hypothetical protein
MIGRLTHATDLKLSRGALVRIGAEGRREEGRERLEVGALHLSSQLSY